jgi:hypothetical protein
MVNGKKYVKHLGCEALKEIAEKILSNHKQAIHKHARNVKLNKSVEAMFVKRTLEAISWDIEYLADYIHNQLNSIIKLYDRWMLKADTSIEAYKRIIEVLEDIDYKITLHLDEVLIEAFDERLSINISINEIKIVYDTDVNVYKRSESYIDSSIEHIQSIIIQEEGNFEKFSDEVPEGIRKDFKYFSSPTWEE